MCKGDSELDQILNPEITAQQLIESESITHINYTYDIVYKYLMSEG